MINSSIILRLINNKKNTKIRPFISSGLGFSYEQIGIINFTYCEKKVPYNCFLYRTGVEKGNFYSMRGNIGVKYCVFEDVACVFQGGIISDIELNNIFYSIKFGVCF